MTTKKLPTVAQVKKMALAAGHNAPNAEMYCNYIWLIANYDRIINADQGSPAFAASIGERDKELARANKAKIEAKVAKGEYFKPVSK